MSDAASAHAKFAGEIAAQALQDLIVPDVQINDTILHHHLSPVFQADAFGAVIAQGAFPGEVFVGPAPEKLGFRLPSTPSPKIGISYLDSAGALVVTINSDPDYEAQEIDTIRYTVRKIIKDVSGRRYNSEELLAPSKPELKFSNKLVSLVREGVYSVAFEVGGVETFSLTINEWKLFDDQQVKNFIETRIRRMFTALADQYRYSGQTSPQISNPFGFTDRLDYMLRDRIPSSPKQFPEVSAEIYSSLTSFIDAGGSFGGNWGRLVNSSAGIYMAIEKPAVSTEKLPRAVRIRSV